MENQSVNAMPCIGDKAPEFKANSTQGHINFPADYHGKWVIFFSHPSDFTPVCTSEFITFGSMADEFKDLNCELLGLSVDGLHSHIAWLRRIHEKIEYRGMKGVELNFPLIDDLNTSVAKKYGMIQPNESSTVAVRAVFFIDPEGTIRAIIYYPLSLGRNFDELKRALIGLQTADAFGVGVPADWRMGDDVIIPPANSCKAAKERMEQSDQDVKCQDWFFCTRSIPKEQIEKSIYNNRK